MSETNHTHTNGHAKVSEKPDHLTNGVNSQFLEHLQSIPLISTTITTYKSHPLGAYTLTLLSHAYGPFATYLSPYLQRPYAYLHPYLAKADELGDRSLSSLETRFPIVRDEPGVLREKAAKAGGRPWEMLGRGGEHVRQVWGEEVGSVRGSGSKNVVNKENGIVNGENGASGDVAKKEAGRLVDYGIAAVRTEIRITREVVRAAWELWARKKEQVEEKVQNGATN